MDNPDVKHNLPQQVTSFEGREKEIAEVNGLLQKTRLITLTGSSGGGKTRLALQVAADLLDGSEREVWLVELAPLTDPGLVPSARRSTTWPGCPCESYSVCTKCVLCRRVSRGHQSSNYGICVPGHASGGPYGSVEDSTSEGIHSVDAVSPLIAVPHNLTHTPVAGDWSRGTHSSQW